MLAWNNYNLRENVSQAIGGLGAVDAEKTIATVENILKHGPLFTPMQFEKLNFLEVKIPRSDYLFILSFHIILLIYLMTLLNFNPSTKTEKADWSLIWKTWKKRPKPSPPWRYFLHPFSSTGLVFFYTMIPYFFFKFWERFFA